MSSQWARRDVPRHPNQPGVGSTTRNMKNERDQPVTPIRNPLPAVLLLASLLSLLPANPARAGTPGASGKIAFDSLSDGDFEIFVMNADGTG